MGRKGRKARVSRDADADGSEEEGAAAPAATGSKSLYEVRRPTNPSWDLGRLQGAGGCVLGWVWLRCWCGARIL